MRNIKKPLALILGLVLLFATAAFPAIAADSSSDIRTIRAFATYDSTLPVKFIDREQYPVWDEFLSVTEKFGISIEWEVIPADQYEITVQTRLAAGNDLPDFMCITPLDNITAAKMGANGTLLPINKIIDEYSDGTAKDLLDGDFAFVRKLTTAPDGNMYWLGDASVTLYADGTPGWDFQVSNIRKDWLDRLNLAVPTTSEEFFDVMKAFRDNDANGNGAADEVMNLDTVSFNNVVAQWYGLAAVNMYQGLTTVDLSTGEVVTPWYQDGLVPYFEFIQKCTEEGIFEPDLIDASWEVFYSYVSSDRLGAINTYATQNYYESMTGNPDAYYIPFGPVSGEEGITPYLTVVPYMNFGGKFAFTKGCEDLEAAGRFLDMLCSSDFRNVNAGIEGVNYEWVDGVRVGLLEGVDTQILADNKTATGGNIWGSNIYGTLPRLTGIEVAPKEVSIENLKKTVAPEKTDFLENMKNYEYIYPDSTSPFYALPTEEQTKERELILGDILTYSIEAATKLSTGQTSIDELDSIIATLKELGLDRLIEIDQDLYDRYVAS